MDGYKMSCSVKVCSNIGEIQKLTSAIEHGFKSWDFSHQIEDMHILSSFHLPAARFTKT